MKQKKQSTQNRYNLFKIDFFLFVIICFFLSNNFALAYMIPADSFNCGGEETSSSTNYKIKDTICDFAPGFSSTSNYQDWAGFRNPSSQEASVIFDIDVGLTSSESSPTYSIVFTPFTETNRLRSSDGSTINSIWLNIDSNAGSGVNISVLDNNGGLKSTAANKTINAVTSSTQLVAGTEGYGVCVKSLSATNGTLSVGSSYPALGNCTYSIHYAGPLSSTSPANIITSTGTIVGGQAEILIKAAIAANTPAAKDYADSLTFIATGTF